MNPEAIEKLRYPIGKFDWEAPRTKEVLNEAIVKIAIENLKRQALHAASLGFKHPITKEFMLFESPIPNDMAELITSLEKLNKQ